MPDFYTIIDYCPCLTTVMCPMTRDENFVPIRTVIAPRLTSLTIHLQFEGNATMFPTMLQAPALEELSLTGLDVCGADLLPGYIVDLITRSNVRLRRFNLCLCIGLPSPSFTELLFLLDACTSVTIDNPSFPDDLTEAIATKDLFPCVEHLDLYSRSNDAPKLFLKSMQTRLEQEAALGATILKHLVLRFDFDLRDDDCGIYGTKAKFRELGTHYGVECKIFWVYEPENEG
ncbi:hypothetical protein H0H93_006228 [Arthromyces matolae]|nr:hypothetical protein H0H93_006228 [Arthromyces matolae]